MNKPVKRNIWDVELGAHLTAGLFASKCKCKALHSKNDTF